MHNEKSISIKEEQTNEMCPEPSTMFLGDPLGDYWSSDHINEDLKPNLGWDENENNNAVVNTLLHTILEAESKCCPPPLLVPKKELFGDHTLEISCLADFIKEDPELNLEADETENIFPEDTICIEDPGLHIKQEPELIMDVDGPEHNDCVKCEFQRTTTQPLVPFQPKEEPNYGTLTIDHQQTTQIKEEETDCAPDETGLMDCVKCEIERTTTQPLVPFQPKEEPVVASTSYGSTSTRLLQSNERCDFPVEENVSQGVTHNELEIVSEESTHFIMFREGEEEEKEEESLSAPRLKCSLRENQCQTFFCTFCLQSFTSKYRLMMHVFVHIDGVEPPKSVCKSCGEVFPSHVSLKKHLEISEVEQVSSADKGATLHCSGKSFTNLGTLKGHALIDTDSRTHKCGICGKSFTKLSKLKRHALIHTGTPTHNCDICGKSFTQLHNLKQHALIHTGTKPHKCVICSKSFTQLSHLKQHALIHTGTKPHKCDICSKSFTRSSHLKGHALLHTGTKPHKCDTCGISFTHLTSLKSHALIHTGTKPHKCDICDKSFTQLSHLKQHALIHTGTKPHKCDICSKSFTRSSHLKAHALIHTGTNPHKCDTCGISFTHLTSLKSHALIHTGTKPHKCDICGKSFTQLSNLKQHALIHTGRKPHKCDICSKYFTQLSNLKQHALIHTRTASHKCDTCGISFTHLSSLKRHSMLHTGT